MIQRIQSVYLLLAAIFIVISFFMPFAEFSGGDGLQEMTACTFKNVTASAEGTTIAHPWGIATLGTVAVVMALVAIGTFKRRVKQIKVVNIFLLLVLLELMAVLAYGFFHARHNGLNMTIDISGVALLILAYASGWLARRAIRKDEDLVRAADRFR